MNLKHKIWALCPTIFVALILAINCNIQALTDADTDVLTILNLATRPIRVGLYKQAASDERYKLIHETEIEPHQTGFLKRAKEGKLSRAFDIERQLAVSYGVLNTEFLRQSYNDINELPFPLKTHINAGENQGTKFVVKEPSLTGRTFTDLETAGTLKIEKVKGN